VFYEALFRQLPVAMALVDVELTICDATDAFALRSGASVDALVGTRLSGTGREDEIARAVLEGRGLQLEPASDGGGGVRVHPVRADDRLLSVVVFDGGGAADPDQLRTVFSSIRTIKHEINNPLTGALGNINLLLRRDDLDEKTRRRLTTAEQEIKKVSQLVVRLAELAPSQRRDE
jgi:signal transduction histidine kinase